MKRHIRIALMIAIGIGTLVTTPALAAFAWGAVTGPAVSNVTGSTWTVTWTINVTTLSGNDNVVCVSTNTGQSAQCGSTTGVLTCVLNNVPNTGTVTSDISAYSGTCASGSKKTQGPTGAISPLAVTLTSFSASTTAGGVTLAWETVSETDNAGFNIYRAGSEAGPWMQVNETLIPAATPGSSEGHAYTWTDANAQSNTVYVYRLESVALDGTAEVKDVTGIAFRPAQRRWIPIAR